MVSKVDAKGNGFKPYKGINDKRSIMKFIIRHTVEKSFDTIEDARNYRDTITTGNVILTVDQDPFGKHFDINPNAAKEK